MNSHSTRLFLIGSALALAVASSGCRLLKKKSDPAPAATATAPVAVAPPAPSQAPAPAAPATPEPTVNVADEAIATTEDFEDEAFAKISDKTYKSDLEALKKEIEEP
ncbi:MAG TPA: hypothetical protein VM686_37865 [Polyangiaceae bacterium]|nr:hypothetical protein [Polyangiaceae bacterium]